MKLRTRVAVVGAIAAAVLLVTIAGARETVFRVESDSMSPAVGVGDVVVAGRFDSGGIERSAIVVFADPGGWAESAARLTGVDSVASTFVKRVIGLPGERVACCDSKGRLTVDGTPLTEPYLADVDSLASVLSFDIAVPPDAIFVLGDNRAASIDSRYLGAVPLSSVFAVEQFTVDLP